MTTSTVSSSLPLIAILAACVADGHIDNDEASTIRDNIYDDGTVDADEVQALFETAESCTYDDGYADLVSDAVRDYAYADGEIDETEASNLRSWIENDGTYSALEIRVLNEVLASGASMPDDFRSWAEGVVAG
jgi:uncharacterized membrane protein YebE (DUF533 family)